MKGITLNLKGDTIGEAIGNLIGEDVKPNLTFSDEEIEKMSDTIKKNLALAGNENPLTLNDDRRIFEYRDYRYEMPISSRVKLCVDGKVKDGGQRMWLEVAMIERWDKEE